MRNKRIQLFLACIIGMFILINNIIISNATSKKKESSKKVVLNANLADSNYLKKVKKIFKNPNVEEIYVYDNTLLDNNSSYGVTYNLYTNKINKSGIIMQTVPVVLPKNVKIKSDSVGKNAIAKTSGSPGDKLSINRTNSISRSVTTTNSANIPVSNAAISIAVGYNVTLKDSLSITGSCTVPKKNNGKKVKTMSYNAYAIYQVKTFDLEYSNGINRKKVGSGTAKRAYGIKFQRKYTYK